MYDKDSIEYKPSHLAYSSKFWKTKKQGKRCWKTKVGGLDSQDQSRSRSRTSFVSRLTFLNCQDFLDGWDQLFFFLVKIFKIEIFQSRLTFWRCRDFLNCRDSLFDDVETNRDPHAYERRHLRNLHFWSYVLFNMISDETRSIVRDYYFFFKNKKSDLPNLVFGRLFDKMRDNFYFL